MSKVIFTEEEAVIVYPSLNLDRTKISKISNKSNTLRDIDIINKLPVNNAYILPNKENLKLHQVPILSKSIMKYCDISWKYYYDITYIEHVITLNQLYTLDHLHNRKNYISFINKLKKLYNDIMNLSIAGFYHSNISEYNIIIIFRNDVIEGIYLANFSYFFELNLTNPNFEQLNIVMSKALNKCKKLIK